ncbi:MAG: mechanosensitive ion channel family protein [Phycisphaerales bacterium]|nr:MAG: mechanosensitive ion channel family protein [Phycisphaerales bacterium]
MAILSAAVADANNVFMDVVNYPVIQGNQAWRFALMLLVVIATLVVGRVVQYLLNKFAAKLEQKRADGLMAQLLKALAKPAYVAVFAVGFYACKLPLYFNDDQGIRLAISLGWTKIARVLGAITIAYALYCLVDIAEYYLRRLVGKTESKLDDMLVPVVRKALRVTIAIIAVLLICEHLLGAENIKSLLLSAGVGGIAIALAAKETVANFFGSITIFVDRPFQMGDLVRIGDHTGSVGEVGFRSTRLRTLEGHLVTIPNSTVANSTVQNIGKRPYIRRTSNITITYDSGHVKAAGAVRIIKEVLAAVPEVNADADHPPRVYFSDFNDWSLNIYMSYWVMPPSYWLYHEVNERVNTEIMKRFEAEQIEFAFPSQTLYVKKD